MCAETLCKCFMLTGPHPLPIGVAQAAMAAVARRYRTHRLSSNAFVWKQKPLANLGLNHLCRQAHRVLCADRVLGRLGPGGHGGHRAARRRGVPAGRREGLDHQRARRRPGGGVCQGARRCRILTLAGMPGSPTPLSITWWGRLPRPATPHHSRHGAAHVLYSTAP